MASFVEVAVALQPAQAAVAHLRLNRDEVLAFQVQRRVEDRLAIFAGAEHTVGHQHVEVDVAVEIAAEPVHERDGAEARAGWRSRAALADRGLDCAQEDREYGCGCREDGRSMRQFSAIGATLIDSNSEDQQLSGAIEALYL